jgi:predicted ester cyclase
MVILNNRVRRKSSTSIQENKKLLGRFVNEVLNKGDMAAFDQLCDPQIIGHYNSDDFSREQFKGAGKAIFAAFPDIKYTIDGLFGIEDKLAARWTSIGPHEGPLFGDTSDWQTNQ